MVIKGISHNCLYFSCNMPGNIYMFFVFICLEVWVSGKIFFFERSIICSQSLHLFDQKNSYIVKYYYSLKCLLLVLICFKMSFIPVMAKLNFQHHCTSLQSHNNPSEIIVIC